MKHPDNNNMKKRVKKNTWLRNLKAFGLRLDRRQRDNRILPVDDDTVRECKNCGKEFTGRFCPQCGQDASWNRFSWKQEGRNVLDYLGLALSKTLKKTKKSKPKKLKPVKKNTLKRKIKSLDLRLDRRQRIGHAPKPADETTRTCANCGEQYTGRFCPQCGQAGAWDRYSWRRVILNFLDIWGLGNRPIFRTIMELFWRPGYMVRDYLFGHRQLYFPPFKLLAVTIALTLFINMVSGEQYESLLGSTLKDINVEELHLNPTLAAIMQSMVDFGQFLSEHPLYDVLILVLFMVCCVRVAFRRVGDYNFVETFIFMIFLICQLNICSLFATPVEYLYTLAENQLLASSSSVMLGIGGLVSSIGTIISSAFAVFTVFLYVFAFHQFYGLSWKATIRRLIFAFIIATFLVTALIGTVAIAIQKGLLPGFCTLLLTIAFCGTYAFASSYLHRNKPLVSKFVFYLSKTLSYLLIVAMPIASLVLCKNYLGHFDLAIVLSIALVLCVLSAAFAFLPSHLYKKFHHSA